MTDNLDKYDPLLPDEEMGERLSALILERIATLDDHDRQRVARAEPGSTEVRRDPDGSCHVWIGFADTVDLGAFSLTALARDATPGSVN